MKANSNSKVSPGSVLRACGLALSCVALVACGGGGAIGLSDPLQSTGSNDVVDPLGAPPMSAPVQTIVQPESGVAPSQDDALDILTTGTVDTTAATAFLAAATQDGELRVMPTGDSITHGIGSAQSYRKGLVGVMADSGCPIKMVGTQSSNFHDTGFYAAHEAYSGHAADYFLTGQTTTAGQNNGVASAVSHQKPEVLLLHVGSVDLWQGQTVESTLADIDQVLATIHDTKPDTLVLIANVIPWFDTSTDANLPQAINTLGTRIEEMVYEFSNPLIHVVDVRAGFTVDMMQSDRIHPNAAGDAHIADAYADALTSLMDCQ